MPYYCLTFNPQVCESHLLEEYLILLKPFIERFSKFSWSIEKDNTINKHLHLIVYNEDPDPKSNFYKKFKTFKFKPFFDKLKNLQTDPNIFLNCKKVKETQEDLQKVLGYVNKDHATRRDKKGFTDGEILSAVEYYYTTEHLDKQTVKDGWTLITSKNIHPLIEQYCQDNNLSVDHPYLKIKMTRDKYSFINVSPKVISRAFKELRIVHNCSDQNDDEFINLEQDGIEHNYDYESHTNCEALVEFIRNCHSIDPEEVPQNITFLLKKYLK